MIPTLSMVLMMALAAVLANVDLEVPETFDGFVYTGDPAAARDILSTTAAAVAGTLTLTLTLTVVALQLVSSQFSPRILRNYLSDRVSKAVVSLLMGTFSFALVTLFYVRSPEVEGEGGFVPAVSISLLLALAVLSLVGLVVFIHNLTQSLRIENVIDTIATSALRTVDRRSDRQTDQMPQRASIPSTAHPVTSKRGGYIVDYDVDRIVSRLSGLRLNMATVPSVGEHLSAGAVAAWVWGIDGDLDHELLTDIRDALNDASTIGPNRSVDTDAAFGVRQLADIAIRALSPGINDPTTATAALDRIGTLLHRMLEVGYSEGRVHRGEDCIVQVARVEFADALEVGFTQPIIYGAGDPMVVREVFRILGDLGRAASRATDRDAIRRQIGLAADVATAAAPHGTFEAEIERLRADALAVVNGEPRIPHRRTL